MSSQEATLPLLVPSASRTMSSTSVRSWSSRPIPFPVPQLGGGELLPSTCRPNWSAGANRWGSFGGEASGGVYRGDFSQFAQRISPTSLPPGTWLDAMPRMHQVAMADTNFNDEGFESNDEDSDGTMKHMSYKDRRREAHTHAEQKRRDAIKKGYEELFNLLPANQQTDSLGSQKLSKAAVLQKSIEYIKHLTSQKKKQEDTLAALQKEVMALKIMKANYEHIVKTHQNAPQQGQNQVPDEVKFQVFQHVMDMLFQSFNASISVATFAELSGCVFNWLEEYCKPQSLREFTMDILSQVSTQVNAQPQL